MMGHNKDMVIEGGLQMQPRARPEPPVKDPERTGMRSWEALSQETLFATTSFILLALLLALALSLLLA